MLRKSENFFLFVSYKALNHAWLTGGNEKAFGKYTGVINIMVCDVVSVFRLCQRGIFTQ